MAAKRNESLGLLAEEIAFYDALAERPQVPVSGVSKLAVASWTVGQRC